MSKEQDIIIIAAYLDTELASQNFEALVKLVKDKKIKSDGMILVQKDPEGKVSVRETGDHVGRKGMGWGGGVGVLVGLFAPVMLAPVVVGAAAGALLGRFAKNKVVDGIEGGLSQTLKPGTAAVLTIVGEDDKLAAEQALGDSPAKSVAVMEEGGVKGLKAALAEAGGKFNPDRTVLPIPDKAFSGVAGRTLDHSVADWSMIPHAKAPDEAPNVLLVLIDDAGFAGPESFGSAIHTPAFTRVQEMGLTYNRFHVIALCSPTRAALLTGRNQHRVGMGSIAEYPGPFPGYTASRPRSCTALPRVLQENGYVTGGFGKWHMTPDNVQGAAGPFNNWPMSWGFDHYWGFLSGAAGQYDPIITQDNTIVGVPEGKDGKSYYFPDDLTDKAVEWLHLVRAQDANKPWFMYYSTGATHAPHHVEKEWADKYKGKFDQGWDKYRQEVFARQKELGIIPPDTELTKRPDIFPAWDTLTDEQKKLYARQMEVFAGFSENTDWNVGRLLDAIQEMGDLENTLVIYIWGDNGASMEGTTTGSFNEMTMLNGVVLDAAVQTKLMDQYGGLEALGSEHTAPHFAAAWAHANNTPFQFGKQMASHLGGTRNPMVMAWPNRINPNQQPLSQFTHVIDVGPTILELVGIPEPKVVDGIQQEPMDGTSFAYTLDDHKAPERHTVQYFEVLGARGIYKDGWWAGTRLDKLPWDMSPQTMKRFAPGVYDPEKDVWELYNLTKDFSQAHDLAAQNPDKLKDLIDTWWKEAERNRALPLLAGFSIFFGILPPLPTTTRFTFMGDVQNIQRGMVPRIYGRSYAIEADLHIPGDGAEGVIVANADFMGGFSLWVDEKGLLHHTYSFLGVEVYRQVSTEPLPSGDISVKMLFEADEPKPRTPGKVSLWANGKQIGEGRVDQTVPVAFSSYAGMDIGRDNRGVVDLVYEDKAPYAFTGTVKKVVFDLKPAHIDSETDLHEHDSIQAVAAGVAA
jgi:arylsulfatase A-like enzyme/uncharacterized membrane protein